MKQYIRPPFPLRPVKNHEVGPVVVSRSGNGMGRGGEYVYSEGERYDNVERVDTRCIGRRREEKMKGGGGGVVKVGPERIESFVES